MSNALSTARYGRTDPGPGWGTQYDLTTNTTLTATMDGALVTNAGAVSALTHTLPNGIPGMEYAFSNVSGFPVTVAPATLEKIANLPVDNPFVVTTKGVVTFSYGTGGEWTVSGAQQVSGAPTALTSNTTIPDAVMDAAYSNVGATQLVVTTLPSAVVGRHLVFTRNNPARSWRLTPAAADRVGSGSNGQYIELLDDDMTVVLRCKEVNHWSVEYQTGVFTYDTNVTGRTLYIDPAGNDANDGSVGSPRKTIDGGIRLLRPGDTLTVNDGAYTGYYNNLRTNPSGTGAPLPHGTKTRWITIKAANRGAARINADFTLYDPDAKLYTVLDGLIWHNKAQKQISCQYLKVKNCGFRGAENSGNKVTVFIGQGYTNKRGAQQILMEDCWVWGDGGRYRIMAYNTKGVVLRRCVTRWDQGWNDVYPAGDISIYDSEDSYVQNCISLDSLRPTVDPTLYYAAFCSTYNYLLSRNHTWQGGIVINNQANGFNCDSIEAGTVGPPSGSGANVAVTRAMRMRGLVVENMAFTKIGTTVNHAGIKIIHALDARVSGCTIADLGAAGYGVYIEPTKTKYVTGAKVDNCVVAFDATGGNAFWGVTASNSLNYATLADAKTAGLTYLPRADASSTIATAWAGADIQTRIGEPGTLAEDPGVEANGSNYGGTYGLWPYPNEALIKTCFSAAGGFGDTDRDWTAGGLTLSQYVWGALGTAGPP